MGVKLNKYSFIYKLCLLAALTAVNNTWIYYIYMSEFDCDLL